MNITKSIFLAGVVSSFLVFPFVFSFLTGSHVDTTGHKKNIIFISKFLLIGTIFLIMLDFIYLKTFNYNLLIALIFIIGILQSFAERSYNSLIKYLIKNEDMDKFISKRIKFYYIGSILGYISVGIFIEINFIQNFLIIIMINILYIIVSIFINTKNTKFGVKDRNFKFFKESVLYIKKNNVVLDLIILATISDFSLDMLDPTLLYIINREFKLSAIFFSIAIIIALLGGVMGSYFSEKLKINKYILYAFSSFIMPIIYLLLISKFIFIIYVSLITLGIIGSIGSVLHNSAMYKLINKNVISSIDGFEHTMVTAAASFSGIIIGFLIYSYSLYVGIIFTAFIYLPILLF